MKYLITVTALLFSTYAYSGDYISILAAPVSDGIHFLNPNKTKEGNLFVSIPTVYTTNTSLTNLNIKVGYCYNYKDGRILGLDDNLDCYDYYVQEADGSEQDNYDITGYVTLSWPPKTVPLFVDNRSLETWHANGILMKTH